MTPLYSQTFTRWANTMLIERMLKIEDIGSDLSDGLLLINLLEITCSKPLATHNKRPRIRAQKLENNGLVLQFLRNEGIKTTAIGPEGKKEIARDRGRERERDRSQRGRRRETEAETDKEQRGRET